MSIAPVKSLVPQVAEGQLGPAMRKLNERQRNFVIAALVTGETKFGKLALMAGYSGNDATLRVAGHRLAHDQRILNAMKEESQRRLQSSTIMATSKLVEIASNDQRKDQLKAIEMVLNRTGLHAITENRSVNLNFAAGSEDGQVGRIKHLCEKLGLDANKLLGMAGVEVVDAEFTEVKPKEEPAAEDDWSGISDES